MSDTQENEVIRQVSAKKMVIAGIEAVNAIDERAIPELLSEPAQAQQPFAYAIIEQDLYPEFMCELYSLFVPDLCWDYLFTPQRDEDLRQAGPVLVYLNHPDLLPFIQALFTARPGGGCLLTSGEGFAATLSWAQVRMTLKSPAGAQAICRFYDPRNLAFFIAGMELQEQNRFWHQTRQLIWHEEGQWWQSGLPIEPGSELIEPYQLNQAHLERVDEYILLVLNKKLAERYKNVIPKDDISVAALTDKVFQLARSYGAATLQDYDAWLRLALERGQQFYQQTGAAEQLEHTCFPLHKRLALLEESLNTTER